MANEQTIGAAQQQLAHIEKHISELLSNYEEVFGVTFGNIAYIDHTTDGAAKVQLKANL